MKKNIIIIWFLFLFLYSCSWEEELITKDDGYINPQATRGYIDLQVTPQEYDNGFELTDDIKTIRFIIFKDQYSYPQAEVNEFREITESNRVTALKAVFEVSLTDKIVVAIANEPKDLSSRLNDVKTPIELDNIELEMGYFLNSDHLALLPGVMMPMSGAIWTSKNSIHPTPEAAEAKNNRVSLSLDRVVARVDIYLTTDITEGLEILPESYIELKNTFTKSWFVHHQDKNGNVLGKIQTVPTDELTSRKWFFDDPNEGVGLPGGAVGTITTIQGNSKPVFLCSFFTPERKCTTDKLRLKIGVKIPGDDGFKSGGIALSEAKDKNDTIHSIDIVRRNTIYEVTFIIRSTSITAIVNGWDGEEKITWEL